MSKPVSNLLADSARRYVAAKSQPRRLKRTEQSVHHRRIKLGILRPDPTHRPWTKAEEAMLGTMADAELAKKLDRTLNGNELRRARGKMPKFDRVRRYWTVEEEQLLRTLTDRDASVRPNRSRSAVSSRRFRQGIPAFGKSVPN